MYNEEQKKKFIRDYTGSLKTAKVAETLFNALEKYELKLGSDVCTFNAQDLQPIVDDVTGLRNKSRWMYTIIMREYVKWCLAMKVPGACDGMLHVESIGLEKIKRQMVASPLHLQKYLDDVFDSESEETIDNIYRCYFWMAYGGIDEEDTILIKADDVDLQRMLIRYKTTSVPIYREAIPAFKNVITLNSFLYKHPNYSRSIWRDRVQGETILRGVRSTTKTFTMRGTISKRNIEAIETGATDLQLSFYRIKMSGLFYRTYEMERAGFPITFSEAALRLMEGKTYSLYGNEKLIHKQNRIEREYFEDYQRWKLAFSI